MKAYKHIKLRNLSPRDGFYIYTPDGRTLKDLYPQFIVRELNSLRKRIKQLEEAGDNLESKKIPTIEDRKAWSKAKEVKP